MLRMLISLLSSLLLVSISTGVLEPLNYGDLETLGVNCPERVSCDRQRHNVDRPYLDRSCECDSDCETYGDCCVDAKGRGTNPGRAPEGTTCLHVGEHRHSGIYAVSDCSPTWNGSSLVRQKCRGPHDFSDLVSAAPVTNIAQGITYKNLYCAVCAEADMQSLQTSSWLQFKLVCENLDDLTQDQIMGDLQYNPRRRRWGVSRLNSHGAAVFVDCQIIFDVPDYLTGSVRFCRSNLVSACAPDWERPLARQRCEEYMAVVYDGDVAYRNPHCALCNHRAVSQIRCETEDLQSERSLSEYRTNSFSILLGHMLEEKFEHAKKSKCLSNQVYDPIANKCRNIVCLPLSKKLSYNCTLSLPDPQGQP